MRLKSYFAPTVQIAIAMARREFGDEITLVTSHVASADARHLGEYEVVFDVEDSGKPTPAVTPLAEAAAAVPVETLRATAPVTAAVEAAKSATALSPVPQFTAFQETLLQAVNPKAAAEEEKSQKLRQIRFTLIELGIEAGLTRAIMSMVEGSIGKRNPRPGNKLLAADAVAAPVTPTPTPAPVVPEMLPVAVAVEPALVAEAMVAESMVISSTPLAEPVRFELSPREQAAEQSGKVVVISKRREVAAATPAVTERSVAAASAVSPVSGLSAAELAFVSSFSDADSVAAETYERLAVGC